MLILVELAKTFLKNCFGGTARFLCFTTQFRERRLSKIYLFENATETTFIVGSNNLTDGGFYTNYEAAIRHDFELPADAAEFRRIADPLLPFIQPGGVTVQRLTSELITPLAARGLLTTEAQARKNRRNQAERQQRPSDQVPANPFQALTVPNPPLLPQGVREGEPHGEVAAGENIPPENLSPQKLPGVLVGAKN